MQDHRRIFLRGIPQKAAYQNGEFIWPKQIPGGPAPTPSDKSTPFYVENISNDVEDVVISKQSYLEDNSYANMAPTITIEKSTDNENWETLGSTSSILHIYLDPGDKVYLRSTADYWCEWVDYDDTSSLVEVHLHGIFWNSIVGCSKVGGNILSLNYGSDFASQNTMKGYDRVFTSIFSDIKNLITFNYSLVDASDLLLISNISRYACYNGMFFGCASLKTAPKLPATTLRPRCYYQMFRNCSSLVSSPALPAQTVQGYSYYQMFHGCTRLTNIGQIDAVTLNDHSCALMFAQCDALQNAPLLGNVTTLGEYCFYYMFGDCDELVSPPSLPASTLVTCCYYGMFSGCKKMTFLVCKATDGLDATNCVSYWTQDVAPAGTFTKMAGTNWPSGSIPDNWEIVEI